MFFIMISLNIVKIFLHSYIVSKPLHYIYFFILHHSYNNHKTTRTQKQIYNSHWHQLILLSPLCSTIKSISLAIALNALWGRGRKSWPSWWILKIISLALRALCFSTILSWRIYCPLLFCPLSVLIKFSNPRRIVVESPCRKRDMVNGVLNSQSVTNNFGTTK